MQLIASPDVGKPVTRQHGFTLMELMVTVAVIAIVAGIGVPAMNSMIAHNRLTSSANELVAAFQFARSEAITRRQTVVVCASDNGAACVGAGTRWMVAAQAANGSLTPLRDYQMPSSVNVSASPSVATANGQITFQPSGYARIGNATDGAISLCDGSLSGDNAMVVSISVARIGSYRRNATAGCQQPANV